MKKLMFTRRPAVPFHRRTAPRRVNIPTILGFALGPIQTKRKKQNSPEGQGRRTEKNAHVSSITIVQSKNFSPTLNDFWGPETYVPSSILNFELRSIFRSKTGCDKLPGEFSQKRWSIKKTIQRGCAEQKNCQISNPLITRLPERRNTSSQNR